METGRKQWLGLQRDEDWYGIQNYTCSSCLVHFCYDAECLNDENGECIESWCKNCEKEYCQNCTIMNNCDACDDGRFFCQKCKGMRTCEGEDCETVLCDDCSKNYTCSFCEEVRCEECFVSYDCEKVGCGRTICINCVQRKGEGGECNACGNSFCSTECQYLQCCADGADNTTEACSTCLMSTASSFRQKFQECMKDNEER